MRLATSDYWSIAEQIEVGTGTIEFEKDGETLCIEYEAEEEGYVEDDSHCGYMNGTGAYVVTSRCLSISSADTYNEEGEDTENNFDEWELEKVWKAAA